MACGLLTKGRGLDCNRISGGVKAVYFAVYDQVLSTTLGTGADLGSITDIDMGTSSVYKYVMPLGVSSVTDTVTGSRENGTIFYTPSINIILNRLTKEDQNQIKLLGATKTIILVELNATLASNGHNVLICLGRVNGMELNAGTMDSGASFGDRGGYTLTFDGLENEPFQMLKDYGTAPLDNLDSGAQIPIISS